MEEKDIGLSEEAILEALQEAVNRITKKNLSGALDTLIYLNFERLLPGKDQKTLQFVDRGRAFGSDRVRETADQIRLCELGLKNSNSEDALAAAKAALARWQQA